MENQLKTYRITMEFTSTLHPRKWFIEAIQENLDETGEQILTYDEEEIKSPVSDWIEQVNQ